MHCPSANVLPETAVHMQAPKLLVLGCTGQVGWELVRSLQPLGQVLAVDRSRADLDHPETLEALIQSEAPAVVVNAAAYTAVDQAETDRARALRINGEAPGILAKAARHVGALLVHYSTDYVFPGDGQSRWRPDDPVAPMNTYGQTKLAGERAIAAEGAEALVFRTSWVYAARGRNFLLTMLRLGAERESLRVVADQIGAPTSARLIAEATAQALKQALAERARGDFASATHHLCAGGETSWHGFAHAIFERWRAIAPAPPLAVKSVEAIASSDYPTPAHRPLNSRLDCSGFEARFGLILPPWQAGLDLVLAELAATRTTGSP